MEAAMIRFLMSLVIGMAVAKQLRRSKFTLSEFVKWYKSIDELSPTSNRVREWPDAPSEEPMQSLIDRDWDDIQADIGTGDIDLDSIADELDVDLDELDELDLELVNELDDLDDDLTISDVLANYVTEEPIAKVAKQLNLYPTAENSSIAPRDLFPTSKDDTMAEAEVYFAYGLWEQAVELLREALTSTNEPYRMHEVPYSVYLAYAYVHVGMADECEVIMEALLPTLQRCQKRGDDMSIIKEQMRGISDYYKHRPK
jgi:tetratricopeptide (TPR) repeat protein